MENLHDGHRQRLREKILSSDAEHLPAHEIVEFLLFYAVPRRNMNPLAHALLNEFGTLQALFSASVEELLRVEGMSRPAAELLYLMGRCIHAYIEPHGQPTHLNTRRQTRNFLLNFFSATNSDGCWLICLSSTGRLTHILPLLCAPDWYAPENMRHAISCALHFHAHSIILAQRREFCMLTQADVDHTLQLMHSLARIQIALVEHVVIDPEGRNVNYATNPIIQRNTGLVSAEPLSPLLAHWLDED